MRTICLWLNVLTDTSPTPLRVSWREGNARIFRQCLTHGSRDLNWRTGSRQPGVRFALLRSPMDFLLVTAMVERPLQPGSGALFFPRGSITWLQLPITVSQRAVAHPCNTCCLPPSSITAPGLAPKAIPRSVRIKTRFASYGADQAVLPVW